jgi:site-specific DNA recombinase
MTPKGEKTLRAVGYCRTSGEGQRDNTSIPTQQSAIESFCNRGGWTFLDHYIDESKSGAKVAGRDSFQRMLKDAALGRFDVIVPFDVSRFARDGVDILGNAKFLRENFGVHVVDTKGGFDSRPGGNVLLNFVHAGVSEYERIKIMERMIGGRIHKAQQGLPWSGKKPFGRSFDKATGKWSINERGRRMKQMLERYVDGEGFTALLKEFTEFSSHVLVLSYIHKSKLSGTYVKEFDIPEINVRGLKVPIPEIPEVISQKLMDRVLARLEHRRTWNQEHRRRYILTGFVKCGHCGTALTGNCAGGRIYYRHCNPKKDCSFFHSIKAEEFAEPVLDYLFSFFTDEPTFTAAIAQALPKADEREELTKQRDEMRLRLQKTENQIGRLIDAIANGADAGMFIGKQRALKEELERHSKQFIALEEQLKTMPDLKALKDHSTAIRLQILWKVKERDWRKLSHDEIRRFLIFLFGENPARAGHGITVYREKGLWRISFKGQVQFFHELANGKPLAHLVKSEGEHQNKQIKRGLAGIVALTQQT